MEGKEVKNAVLYTAEACAEESPSRGCLIDKRYVSMLGTWTTFALLLWVALRQLRFDQAKVLVVLSDGAKWIRELAQWLPCSPRVLLILDLYHAICVARCALENEERKRWKGEPRRWNSSC